MDKLKKLITDSRKIRDSSVITYMSNLKKIHKNVSDEPMQNFDFLLDFDKIMKIIESEKVLTSRKNRLTSVLVALNTYDKDEKMTKLIKQYSDELKKMNETYFNFLKEQKKTEKQEANWVEYADLVKVFNELKKEAKHRGLINKKKSNIGDKDFELLQQLLILITYLNFPVRNNFANMKVVSRGEYSRDNNKHKHNYLVVGSKGRKFYFNNFKNSTHLGPKIYDVPQDLNKLINIWLHYNTSGYYLTKRDRETPMNSNGITKIMNRIFKKRTGKNISTSMLRHIIITEMNKGKKTIKELENEKKEIENKFMHSVGMNQLYLNFD